MGLGTNTGDTSNDETGPRIQTSIVGKPRLYFLGILIPVTGEQVCSPCSLPSRVITQSQPFLASASVSYDTMDQLPLGRPN